jgi:hypothetical protein
MRSTQEWLTDRGMTTCASRKAPPLVRTLAWLAWPQSHSVLILGGVIIVRLCIKKEETTLVSQPRYQCGPAILHLNWALHQPRHCHSQHSACLRLNTIIGRLHATPLYWPHPSRVLPATCAMNTGPASKHIGTKPLHSSSFSSQTHNLLWHSC